MDKLLEQIEQLERRVLELIDLVEMYDDVGHPKIMLYKQELNEKRMKLEELKKLAGLS